MQSIFKAGPIPGDCDYSELRTAFLSHGQTCHLFIQNNQAVFTTLEFVFLDVQIRLILYQAWLERNQEKFGSRQVIIQNIGVEYQNVVQFCPQVKFGYVVFTEAETAERLFRQGGVVVRRASGEQIQV